MRLHFVCRDNLNVTETGGGTFETGFWKVSAQVALKAKRVYLHQTKEFDSYLQGSVVGIKTTEYLGKPRFIFVVQQDEDSMHWEGNGSGEKGYGY